MCIRDRHGRVPDVVHKTPLRLRHVVDVRRQPGLTRRRLARVGAVPGLLERGAARGAPLQRGGGSARAAHVTKGGGTLPLQAPLLPPRGRGEPSAWI
eukprot:9483870-Pyramimonas_sp.AAC.1